jgi:hypothetical protein
LEKGRFHWPVEEEVRSIRMRGEELALLLNGLDLKYTAQRDWYRRPA